MLTVQRKILFVCIHNSARSQMAEAFLNEYGSEYFSAESAGLEAGKLNLNAVAVMKEVGIDISQKGTQSVFDVLKQGKHYDGVITVCDETSAESCPVFPGDVNRLSWAFADPSMFLGTTEEVLERTREVRDEIKEQILSFISEESRLR